MYTIYAGATPSDADGGFRDGPRTEALFACPGGICLDRAGNLLVADKWNNRVRRVGLGGEVRTLAGSGVQGCVDGAALEASFDGPEALCMDGSDNIYVGQGYCVRKIDPGGKVTTIAKAAETGFKAVQDICITASGELFILDRIGQRIWTLAPGRRPTSFGLRLRNPYGHAIALAKDGSILVSDSYAILRVEGSERVSFLVDCSDQEPDDDVRLSDFPGAMCFDPVGNLYILDSYAGILRLSPEGTLSLFARRTGSLGAICVSGDGALYATDVTAHRILRYSVQGLGAYPSDP
jgi:sugar lactone lactonase YvrE